MSDTSDKSSNRSSDNRPLVAGPIIALVVGALAGYVICQGVYDWKKEMRETREIRVPVSPPSGSPLPSLPPLASHTSSTTQVPNPVPGMGDVNATATASEVSSATSASPGAVVITQSNRFFCAPYPADEGVPCEVTPKKPPLDVEKKKQNVPPASGDAYRDIFITSAPKGHHFVGADASATARMECETRGGRVVPDMSAPLEKTAKGYRRPNICSR